MRQVLDQNGKRWRVRPDGEEKVTGKLRYLTDISFPNMLYGKVLRSAYPHARIKSINITQAESLDGVSTVITHRDIPGLNGFGIANPDQPVFCDTIVRYEGDAIAAVAAISEEVAEKALQLIQVEYEELPVLDSPEAALAPTAPQLHEDGNILHTTHYSRGQHQVYILSDTGAYSTLGFTLTEDAVMQTGRYVTKNLDTYMIPTILDVPVNHNVDAIETLPHDDPFGPRGVGEVGSVALAPAIVSAIHDATGIAITKLPISPELLMKSSPFLEEI